MGRHGEQSLLRGILSSSGCLGAASMLWRIRMIYIVMVIGCRSGLLSTTVEDMSGCSSIPPHRLHPQNLTQCMQSIHKISFDFSYYCYCRDGNTTCSCVVRFHEQQSACYQDSGTIFWCAPISLYTMLLKVVVRWTLKLENESHVPVLKGKLVCRSFNFHGYR